MIRIHKLKKTVGRAYFWAAIYAKNGEPLMHSETFTTKASVLNDLRAIAGVFGVTDTSSTKVLDCTTKTEKKISL
jgi:uncharacterized protein YegP (UPF0339 family)